MARDSTSSTGSTTDTTGVAGSGGAERVLITVDQLVDYVACPLRFAFTHVYKALDKRKPSAWDIWAVTLGDMFVWMHIQLSDTGTLKWINIVDRWQAKLAKAYEVSGISLAENHRFYQRGARYLLDMFEGLPKNMHVLGYLYPCRQKVGRFELEGCIDVIRMIEGKGRAHREIQYITVDTRGTHKPSPFEVTRRIDYLMVKYGLEQSLRQPFYRAAGKHTSWVFLPKVPTLAKLDVPDTGLRTALGWGEHVLQSIADGLFYPRIGDACSSCEYNEVCSATYVSDDALDRASHTTEEIRRKIDER